MPAPARDRFILIGVFEDMRLAQEAVSELERLGFDHDQIGVAAREDGNNVTTAMRDEAGTKAAEGAVTGVAAGASVGALWAIGIAAGMLPAVGPVVAGGLLASLLASAAGGAAVAGLAGALIGLGIPEDEAKYYEEEFRSGRTLVTVKSNGRHDEITAVFQRYGAYDMQNRNVPRSTQTAGMVTPTVHPPGPAATGGVIGGHLPLGSAGAELTDTLPVERGLDEGMPEQTASEDLARRRPR